MAKRTRIPAGLNEPPTMFTLMGLRFSIYRALTLGFILGLWGNLGGQFGALIHSPLIGYLMFGIVMVPAAFCFAFWDLFSDDGRTLEEVLADRMILKYREPSKYVPLKKSDNESPGEGSGGWFFEDGGADL